MNVFNRIRKRFMHSYLRRQGGGRGGSKVGGGTTVALRPCAPAVLQEITVTTRTFSSCALVFYEIFIKTKAFVTYVLLTPYI